MFLLSLLIVKDSLDSAVCCAVELYCFILTGVSVDSTH